MKKIVANNVPSYKAESLCRAITRIGYECTYNSVKSKVIIESIFDIDDDLDLLSNCGFDYDFVIEKI